MKFLLTNSFILFSFQAMAQSPGLIINLSMDSAKTSIRYKIEMKICEPIKKTKQGDWLKPDTSRINFASLLPKDISCGEYSDNGIPTFVAGDGEQTNYYNRFKFSNQVFAWEKIFVFRITSPYTRGWWPAMYIVVPMKYKSFITYIDLSDIEFKQGRIIFLSPLNAVYTDSRLHITHSLKDMPSVEVKNSPLKELLEKD